jgi:hypothetical protein
VRKLISPYGFGWLENGKIGRFKNETLIRRYNSFGYIGSPTNDELLDHFTGETTLYFWADGRMNTPLTISMIDVDCHKTGDPQSATAFAEWLAVNYFPCLYHEPSTNRRGRHGYFLLSKYQCNDLAVAKILKVLETALKKLLRVFLATYPQYQVEGVEIKGTPHLIKWAWGKERKIEWLKSGMLAKLPRHIVDRFDEFKNTTVLSFDDIRQIEGSAEKLTIPDPKKLSIFKGAGSTSTHPIPRHEIDTIKGPYLHFAKSWISKPMHTSSRATVDAADLAIALPIVKYCSQMRNTDGTMPTKRIKRIWDALFEEGEVDWAFDYHRWKTLRNLIESHGGLEMIDRRYYTGFVNEGGKFIKGVAAKWKMSDWLIEKLDEIAELGFEAKVEDIANSQELPRSWEQELGGNQAEVTSSLPMQGGGGALLEQDEYHAVEALFDRDWIIEFSRSLSPIIGLIWAGSIQNQRREAG